MSAFDEGYIKTARGKIIDFTKSIIIATTNAGHTTKSDPIGFIEDDDVQSDASVSDLSRFFDVELLNRFTKVINFNPITRKLFTEIAADTYKRNVQTIKDKHPSFTFLADEMDDAALEKFTKDNFVKEYGARPIKAAIQKYIEDAVLDFKHNNAANLAAMDNAVLDGGIEPVSDESIPNADSEETVDADANVNADTDATN